MQRKKILLLGGSPQQVIAIEKAKSLGYETILCDYLPDNPGRLVADRYYPVSTTDKEEVLTIGKCEKVDGIIAYASDPAAPTAAYVSEALGLPGIPYQIALQFCEKHLFRRFLQAHDFNTPKSREIDLNNIYPLCGMELPPYPLVIKPTDSSGSKGVTIINDASQLENAINRAAHFSRNGLLIAEEFIQRCHPHVIEAELIISDGKIVSWGLINSIRDENVNNLLPSSYSYPLLLSDEQLELVIAETTRLVESSEMQFGAFNIEMIIDAKGRLYFLDAGPRCGGNMLPDFISKISESETVEMVIRASMGERIPHDLLASSPNGTYWGLVVLHSDKEGVFKKVAYSDVAKRCLEDEKLQTLPGEVIRPFKKCNDLLGVSFFKFDNQSDEQLIMEDYYGNVFVKLEDSVKQADN